MYKSFEIYAATVGLKITIERFGQAYHLAVYGEKLGT